jgi:signal transduction histidine kinase/CheY-like chemotaxis protein
LVGVNSVAAIEFGDQAAAQENLAALKTKNNIVFAGLYTLNGKRLAHYQEQPSREITNKALLGKVPPGERGFTEDVFGQSIIVVREIRLNGELIGYIEVWAGFDDVTARLYEILLIAVFIITGAILASVFLAYKLENVLSDPINQLVSTMHRVSANKDYSLRVTQKRDDELGLLIKGFNNMLAQIEVRNRALEYSKQHLEETVQARTEELANARDKALSASRAKSIFLANMSHEIRTPMNAVLGFAQLLSRENLASEQADMVRRIETAGNNLLVLINDILDLSKIEAGQLASHNKDFDLRLVLQELSYMFSMRCRGRSLTWCLDADLSSSLPVNGDAGKLNQILINLLGNAVKFTPSGSLTLRVSQISDRRGDKLDKSKVEAGLFRFEVIDTGIGISEQDQTRIFLPFEQTDSSELIAGTGLGLSISQGQLAFIGSKLQLDSRKGKGSRFFFDLLLPPAKGDVPELTGAPAKIYRIAEGFTIRALVVDDSITNRDLLKLLLASAGIDVREATNGLDALECVKQQCPDVIFMDIRMPVMDGLETLQRLHKEYGKDRMRIIAISASSFDHQAQYFLDNGFDYFISKPFQLQEIFDCLSKLLNVAFEYETEKMSETATVAELEDDISHIQLPETLHQKLIEMAEFGMVTEFESILVELEKNNSGVSPLVERCRALLKNFDLKAIVSLLKSVSR